MSDTIIPCGIGRGRQLTDEEMQIFQGSAQAYAHNRISVTVDSLQAGFVFRQPEPWLIVDATGEVRLFDEKEMRLRLAEGVGKNGVEDREYQTMMAIAAVLDHERERAARINKTEL